MNFVCEVHLVDDSIPCCVISLIRTREIASVRFQKPKPSIAMTCLYLRKLSLQSTIVARLPLSRGFTAYATQKLRVSQVAY